MFIVVFLIGAGCNSQLLRPPATIYADAGGRPISASLGEQERTFSSVLLSFFPSRVPLHPGDAVNFEVRDSGEPHTVALGRLVDAAVTALGMLGTTEELRTVEALPEMRRLPTVFPKRVEDGRPRVNRSAAERCFLATGEPPVSETGGAPACPDRGQPEFDGTQTFYSGGFLKEGEPFRVTLSGDIRPGEYAFMCLVHRTSMTGTIEVRPRTVDRPPVAELREQADVEENAVASTLEASARRVLGREVTSVLAGTGPEGRSRGLLASFVPDVLRIRQGRSVTWELYGTHSISFDPDRQARDGVLVEEGDGIRINLDAWRPVAGPPPPAAAVAFPPTEPNVVIDGGSWSGEETFSSGILRATPPGKVTYSLRFNRAGTYRYLCLVHQRMRGTIEVEEG